MPAGAAAPSPSPKKTHRPRLSLSEITPDQTVNVEQLAAKLGFPCVRCVKRVFLTNKSKNATVVEKASIQSDEVLLEKSALCCRYEQHTKCQYCRGLGKACFQLKREHHNVARPLMIYGLAALEKTLKDNQKEQALKLQHAVYVALETKPSTDRGAVIEDSEEEEMEEEFVGAASSA